MGGRVSGRYIGSGEKAMGVPEVSVVVDGVFVVALPQSSHKR